MNYSLAFSFVKDEKDWILKLLVSGLISLIPVIGQLYLIGWLFEIARRTASHESMILPDVNFSAFIKSGFKLTVIAFVYMLPCTILSIISSISGNIIAESKSGLVRAFGTAISCSAGLVSVVIGIALSLLLIAAYARFFETNKISDAFNVFAVWNSFRKHAQDYLILWIFDILVSLIALFGFLFCLIGILFTFPYSYAVWGHLFGQMMQKIGIADQSTINP